MSTTHFKFDLIPQSEEAKCLGIHLDKHLTWKTHIFAKRKALGIKLRNLYWLLNPNSKLSLENKLLIYKTILKLVCAYGIQLWVRHPMLTSKYSKDFNQRLLEKYPMLHTTSLTSNP